MKFQVVICIALSLLLLLGTALSDHSPMEMDYDGMVQQDVDSEDYDGAIQHNIEAEDYDGKFQQDIKAEDYDGMIQQDIPTDQQEEVQAQRRHSTV